MTGRPRSAARAKRSSNTGGDAVEQSGSYLRHGDAALLGQLLFGFLARVRVREVRVEILVQHLRGLFTKITPLASDKERRFHSQILVSSKCRKQNALCDPDSLN